MIVLIYWNCLEGHNLEYIHHLYERAAIEEDKEFVFVLPEEFLELKKLMEWSDCQNILFDYLSEEETKKCNYNKYFHFLGTQTYSAWLLSKKIRRYKPDHVFMDIDVGIPFIELFPLRSKKTKISCICYRIIPYQWNSLPLVKKAIEWLTYHVVLKKNRYDTVMLLNTHKYVDYYNNKFHTNKYKYLTDPVTTDLTKGSSLRDSLNIPMEAKVFVHLGVMGRHKGTLNLLDAIRMLSEEDANDNYFIFGGKVLDDIRDEFYKKLEKLVSSYHIIVYDEFCKYELFCSLYKTCDYVIFPYLPRPNSSGLLGNAALYGKPVITTDGGAMGDLVREYHLGRLMPDNNPDSIFNAIKNPQPSDFAPMMYVKDHTIDNFCNQVFSIFK